MKKLADSLALLAVTAWAGALWGVGYLAVPVLFKTLSDKMLAGELAGKMFTLVAITGIVCAAYLLIYYFSAHGRATPQHIGFRLVVIMLVLALIVQFGLQPAMAGLKAQALPLEVMKSPLAGRFGMLHGISSVCYLVQSLLAVMLVIRRQASPVPQNDIN